MKVPRLEPIAAAAARLGGISRVVLGHGDTDHRGSAPELSNPTTAQVPQEASNLDTAASRESIRRVAALRPRIVGVGHLGPMTGPGVVAELEAAAAG